MPFVPVKVERTRRPPAGTPIRNDGHWSVQGLTESLGFLDVGSSQTVFSSKLGLPYVKFGTNHPVVDPSGLTWAVTSGIISPNLPPYLFNTSDFTVVIGFTRDASGTGGYESFFDYGVGSAQKFWAGINAHTPRFWSKTDSTYYTANTGLANGRSYVMGFRAMAGIGRDIWLNGKLDSGLGNPISYTPAFNDKFCVASTTNFGSEYEFVGTTHFVHYYSRALSPAEIASISANPWQVYEPEVTWYSLASTTPTLNQHSFRFFNDDGSESAATAKAATNTDIILGAESAVRLRMLVNATGDPTGKQFQLEYRRKPSGGLFGAWNKVN